MKTWDIGHDKFPLLYRNTTKSDVYDLDEMMQRTWDIGNLTMEVVNTTTEKTKIRNLVDAMTC